MISETGVIEIRLFATLIPNSSPISSTVCTSRAATARILSPAFCAIAAIESLAAIEQAQTECHRAHVEMLHLGHRDGLQNLGLGVFHLSDYFAENQQNEKQNKERCGDEQKTQTRIVRGLIDHDARNSSYASRRDRAHYDQLLSVVARVLRCWRRYGT